MTELPVEDPGDGELCIWCGSKVKRSGIGRRRRYCSDACKQAAYERRRIERAVAAALAAEEAPPPPEELPTR